MTILGWLSEEAACALDLEPPQAIGGIDLPGGQHLDGDQPIEPRITRAVDLAHSAGSQGRHNLIGA
jgi:hypothetical protein